MIIEKNLTRFIVFSEDSLLNALRKISENKVHLVFTVTETGVIDGVLSDGDFRRWLTSNNEVNLNVPVGDISNKNFFSLPIESSHDDIEKSFNDRVNIVPLVDNHNHLVAIALKQPSEFRIGKFLVGANEPSFIIAEIGNNHNGSLEQAKMLVDEAIRSGANCVKFQLRNMSELYKDAGLDSDSSEDLGSQYTLDLLSRFQLSLEDMFAIFDYCKTKNILPLCTPWDKESLKSLEKYEMEAYKVASADLSNHDLLEAIIQTRKPIICSTGMSNESEIIEAVRLLKQHNAKYILLHCNSTYPAPFKDIHLNYIDRLAKIGDCEVGYSGHERGISIALAAVAKGARVIEKHFTLDRNMEGNDHKISLLPNEFKAMVNGIREIEQALGVIEPRKVTQGELMNREILAKSLIINCALKHGEIITSKMIEVKSPGKGLSPNRKKDLIGKKAKRDFKQGDFFYLSDIESHSISPRKYSFKRPFGIPVRYHDVKKMLGLSNFDLLEFHMSYKDLEEDPSKFLNDSLDVDFVIHSPELFSGDHILDLCSKDKKYRERSIKELQKVVDLTKSLKKFFPKTNRPLIIVNAGGFSMEGFCENKDRLQMHELIAESLEKIKQDGVEIIPQTMPPFPWHFGGQRYHNAFVLPEDIVNFCANYNYRVCLDISHSQLACNYYDISFREFLDLVGPYTAHMHIVDAEGIDGEGLQIGDGMTDFELVADILNKQAPKASFIPEIWQGHKNNGEGFWVGLDKLERWF